MASDEEVNSSLIKRESGCDLTLVVQRPNGPDVSLETKGDIPLYRLLLDYCHQMGLIYEVIRFTYDGVRIEKQTPDELEMEDGDIIDAWSDQTGGGMQMQLFGYV